MPQPDPSIPEMIDYLVADRGRSVEVLGGVEHLKKYREELNALSGDALKAQYETVFAAAAQRQLDAAKVSALLEAFGSPPKYPPADFDYWAKFTYWKVDEGLALLLEIAPDSQAWSRAKGGATPEARQFASMREVATRAIQWKQLHDPSYPGSFIAWAKRMKFPVPTKLEEGAAAFGHFIGDWYDLFQESQNNYAKLKEQYAANLEKATALTKETGDNWAKQYRELGAATSATIAEATQALAERNARIDALTAEVRRLKEDQAPRPSERPIGSRETDSIRKLMIGMAMAGYKYDPNASRSGTIAEIVSDLDELGIQLGDDTVRRLLKEASALVPPAGSPERKR